jgi:hypothetical protein
MSNTFCAFVLGFVVGVLLAAAIVIVLVFFPDRRPEEVALQFSQAAPSFVFNGRPTTSATSRTSSALVLMQIGKGVRRGRFSYRIGTADRT